MRIRDLRLRHLALAVIGLIIYERFSHIYWLHTSHQHHIHTMYRLIREDRERWRELREEVTIHTSHDDL